MLYRTSNTTYDFICKIANFYFKKLATKNVKIHLQWPVPEEAAILHCWSLCLQH